MRTTCCCCGTAGQGNVSLGNYLRIPPVKATRCCVTVFACTSGRGNLLLCYTVMEGIACCKILFMESKFEF